MKIPSCFYGSHKKVKAQVSKLYTQIKKGKPLEDIFSPFEMFDVNDYPIEYVTKYAAEDDPGIEIANNLIWIEMGVPFGGGLDHFILSAFSDPLYRLAKFSPEETDEMQARLAPFLATTAWGCVVLNNPQAHWDFTKRCSGAWVKINGQVERRCSIDPDLSLLILESSVKYWDDLLLLGNRFFDGLEQGTTITKCQPNWYRVLSRLGCEPEETFYGDKEAFCIKCPDKQVRQELDFSLSRCSSEEEQKKITKAFNLQHPNRYFKFGHVKDVCEKYNLLDRLKNDEAFRKQALEGTLLNQKKWINE